MSILFMFIPFLFMLVIFGLFVWQAVWVAIDSRKKGEEYWWLWTIAAIVAFPIGLIIYVIVINNDRNSCKDCGKDIPKEVNVCPYCGQKCGYLCSNCGQKLKAGWRYCPNCTTEVPENIILNTNKKNTNKLLVAIISIILGVFIIIVGMFIFNFISVFTSFGYVGNTEVEYVAGSSQWPESDGYIGKEYEKSYSDKIEYNISPSTHSFWYKGEVKKGEINIKVYDESGNNIGSKTIKSDDFTDVFVVDNANKVEVEFKGFKGSFYYRFN